MSDSAEKKRGRRRRMPTPDRATSPTKVAAADPIAEDQIGPLTGDLEDQSGPLDGIPDKSRGSTEGRNGIPDKSRGSAEGRNGIPDKSRGSAEGWNITTADQVIAPEPAPAREDDQATAGHLDNSDPTTDPVKLELQHRAYEMHVTKRWSDSRIARELGLERHTVAAYCEMEWSRRHEAAQANLAFERHKSIVFYESMRNKAEARMYQPGARGDDMRYALQAQENIDKLKGLHAPIKVDHGGEGGSNVVNITPQQAVFALIQIGERMKAREASSP